MLELQRFAAQVVGRVLGRRSLDAELRELWSHAVELTPQDRATIQDACYGTLRFLGQVDAMLEHLLQRPLTDEPVRHLLRVALYQLTHTRAAPYAVVDHAVRACGALGEPAAKGLVNAVLRNFLRQREAVLAKVQGSEVGRYSHPQWWIDKLRAQYPTRYTQMLANANRRPPLILRVNRRRTSVEAYLARVAAAGIGAQALGESAVLFDVPMPVERIPGFADGEVSVQDAAAQHAALLLGAEPGSSVLDACAAPGGKTAHILELADVDLVALDNNPARLERVQSNLARLQLTARVVCGDAAAPAGWWNGETYDCILADVPCSASGVVRRHPDIKWLRRPGDIASFAERQRAILRALWQLLASGGKLLYATCSVFHEENQDQIAQFLERHPDARHLALPGLDTKDEAPAGQILPDEQHDGFFYALLQKA